MCKSILQELALKRIIKKQLSTYKECDIVVSDQKLNINKPSLTIGYGDKFDIKKPFTPAIVLYKIEQYEKYNIKSNNLEAKVEKLMREYTEKLMALMNEKSN